MKQKIALITGATRGLGRATALALVQKSYTVILTGRNKDALVQLENELKKISPSVFHYELDVNDPESINAQSRLILNSFGHMDVLINNAGIYKDGMQEDLKASAQDFLDCFQTNTLGPALMCHAFFPSMKRHQFGRIVNVSSGMGQLKDMNSDNPAYRVSKTALNAVTKIFAQEGLSYNVLVNSVCPGWVKTEMGGSLAPRTVEEGIAGIVWAATLPDGGPTGGFFRDSKEIPW